MQFVDVLARAKQWEMVYGDNLEVMRKTPPACVDLVYMDPPFCTGKDFGAFDDRWKWTTIPYHYDRCELPEATKEVINVLDRRLGKCPELAYLVHLAQRFVEIKRLAKPTANIVVHVDERLAHYVRLLLDTALTNHHWSSTIIWRYRRWPAPARRFQHMHDVLLHYTGDGAVFNELRLDGVAKSTKATFGTRKQKAIVKNGRRATSTLDEETLGPPLADVWELPIVAPSGNERKSAYGYPTQKPEALLDRIVLALSNPGDVVLDPNAGSGTSGARAVAHGRRWLGIDSSVVAVDVTTKRMGEVVAI
jgi:site-specific DNA-methyltransferase (adenine-specific)